MTLTPAQITFGCFAVFYLGAAWALWTTELLAP